MPARRPRPLFLAVAALLTVAVWPGASTSAAGIARRAAAAIAAAAADPRVDRVVVEKRDHRLTLWSGGAAWKTYRVALGRGGLAPKTRQGDDLVPEGFYRIDARNAQSAYHLALHISYPNAADLARARKLRVEPGGDIMIHGLPNHYGWIGGAHRLHDWTRGCIAVTNDEIEEIWRLVPAGTPVEIRP